MNAIKFERKSKQIWLAIGCIVLILSIARYFTKITAYPAFYNDERFSVDTVTGLINSGKLYRWDWRTNTISDKAYTRAWPYTFFLSIWIRIFGFSLTSARASSAFLGCLFMLSFVYISKKWFDNLVVTVLGSLLLLMDSAVTFYFRYVRMYSLWMVLLLWMMYYLHKGLTEHGRFRGKTTCFNYPMLLIGFVLLIISYATHVNTLGIALGIVLFLIISALISGEKRYKVLSAIGIGCIFVAGGCYALYTTGLLPQSGNVISDLFYIVSVQFKPFKKINNAYLFAQLGYLGEISITVIALISGIFICINNKCYRKPFTWLICIYIFNLFFFMCLADRYYKDRYALFLDIITAIICACGLSFLFQKYAQGGILLSIGVLIFCFAEKFSSDYYRIYTSYDCCDYDAGFTKLSDIISERETGIIQHNLYDKYLYEDFMNEHSEIGLLTMYFNDEGFPYDELLSFVKEHPQGILLCEENKYKTSANSIYRQLISTWTDPICAPGMDPYHFYISRYHFLFPEQPNTEQERIINPFYNGAVGWTWASEEKLMKIFIHADAVNENTEFIAIKLLWERVESYYQLQINGFDANDDGYYVYEIQFPYVSMDAPVIKNSRIFYGYEDS